MTDEDKKITEKKCREVDEVGAGDRGREKKRVSDRQTKSRRICSRATITSERRTLCQKEEDTKMSKKRQKG